MECMLLQLIQFHHHPQSHRGHRNSDVSPDVLFACRLSQPMLLAISGSTIRFNYIKKDPEFILQARHFRKALGGGVRQVGALTTAARVAVHYVSLSGVHLPRANAIAKDLEES